MGHYEEQRLRSLFDALPEEYRERFEELYMGRTAKTGHETTALMVHTVFDNAVANGKSVMEALAYLVLVLDDCMEGIEAHRSQLIQNQTFAGFTVPLAETKAERAMHECMRETLRQISTKPCVQSLHIGEDNVCSSCHARSYFEIEKEGDECPKV